jgi:hypothetical protein
MSEGMNIQLIRLDAIRVGERLRTYREEGAVAVADSIRLQGPIDPIMVRPQGDAYALVAGLHRLEACRMLGWTEVPAIVRVLDDHEAALVEIDENLSRTKLSALERGEHLLRRSQILEALGRRAPSHRPKKGVAETPLETTAALAERFKIGQRAAQRGMQVARQLPKEVRDILRPSAAADNLDALLDLAKEKDAALRLELAKALANSETEVWRARSTARELLQLCITCEQQPRDWKLAKSDSGFAHCSACGNHYALDVDACGNCGRGGDHRSPGRGPKTPPSPAPPAPPSRRRPAGPYVPSLGRTLTPGIDYDDTGKPLPGAFFKKDEYRRPDRTIKIDADDFIRALGGDDTPSVPEGKAQAEILKAHTPSIGALGTSWLAAITDEQLRAEIRDIVGGLEDWIARAKTDAEWLSGEEVRQ